ncbi:MAG: site-specific integrase [Prevotellaceae bacterium]|jgi:integrase|nr:site-specific integrase [Prevotellaceae bacterium]
MSNKKSTPKVKEPIKIRFKKLTNGNKSIYLAFWNTALNKWEYEFLKNLYIVPDRNNPIFKKQNEEALKLANTVKAQKVVELQNAAHGFKNSGIRSQINVVEYITALAEKKRRETGNKHRLYQNYSALARHIEQYSGGKTTFKKIDKAYCLGFIEHIKNAKSWYDSNKPLHDNTKHSYIKILTIILNAAVTDDILISNPLNHIKPELKPKKKPTERCFLTIDEVRQLARTECYTPEVKRAFLFSCFSGLRFSDVAGLTWQKIETGNNGDRYIKFIQEKTNKPEYLPLNTEALKFVGEQGTAADSDRVFAKLPQNKYCNVVLKEWAGAAGITTKHVTFHVARHTAATMILSLGGAIETVSKILGHSEIRTTQIYAKILDKNVSEAVHKLDGLTD